MDEPPTNSNTATMICNDCRLLEDYDGECCAMRPGSSVASPSQPFSSNHQEPTSSASSPRPKPAADHCDTRWPRRSHETTTSSPQRHAHAIRTTGVHWTTHVIVMLIIMAQLPLSCHATGTFQFQLTDVALDATSASPQQQYIYRLCLKQYQRTIDPTSPCTFGEHTSAPFRLPLHSNADGDDDAVVTLPISFAWPGDYSLIVEVHRWGRNGNESAANDTLLLRLADRRTTAVSTEWTRESHPQPQPSAESVLPSVLSPRLRLRYRAVCDVDYYGTKCAVFCQPRDDLFGHYRCGRDGQRVCAAGWAGDYCSAPACKPGCHPLNGHCTEPGACACKLGWYGELCDQCQRYPGCQHGTCERPFECTCDEGWGGLFCNQDLNYCTHHEPCTNGATCTNTGAGHYTCTCAHGFTGTNCELAVADCSMAPCVNGGVCTTNSPGNYTCTCPRGFSGRHCQVSARSCGQRPCANGATCVDHGADAGFTCLCPPGFDGETCDVDRNECSSSPCQNGGRCVDQTDTFRCVCPMGFEGPQCEFNVNDCSDNACFNGGTCLDEINAFKCRCAPGFIGSLCQTNIDDCVQRPCANGGTCFDEVNDFRCLCRPGFAGKDCRVDVNECATNPCRNGGTCTDQIDSFKCTCPPCHSGARCERRNDECARAMANVSVEFDRLEQAAPSSSDSLHRAVLLITIPVLVGTLVAVVVVAVLVFLLYRRFAKHQQQPPIVAIIENKLGGTDAVDGHGRRYDPALAPPSYEQSTRVDIERECEIAKHKVKRDTREQHYVQLAPEKSLSTSSSSSYDDQGVIARDNHRNMIIDRLMAGDSRRSSSTAAVKSVSNPSTDSGFDSPKRRPITAIDDLNGDDDLATEV